MNTNDRNLRSAFFGGRHCALDFSREFRCSAIGCDAELRTAHECEDFGWHGEWSGSNQGCTFRAFCPVHKATEPESVEGLAQEKAELRRQLEDAWAEVAHMSGDVAELGQLKSALKTALDGYRSSENDDSGEELFETVEAIESGDYWYEEYTGP